MSILALTLVFISTFCHAFWNMILKKVQGGILFIWFFTLITTLCYIPFLVALPTTYVTFTQPLVLYICVSSMIVHLFYFIFLDKAYQYGDLSIIYPVARGIAPVLTIIAAFFLLNESLSTTQLFSVCCIIFGTFTLSGFSYSRDPTMGKSLAYALVCGIMVASFTLIDKVAISQYAISPFLLDFINNLGRTVMLCPYALNNKTQLKDLVQVNWKEGVMVALLSPLSYLLVLYAMKYAPISLIAPLRQFSIVIGGILGVKLLCENRDYAKLLGIGLTFFGIVLLNF